MTAALLAEHGMRTGAYLSPHLRSLEGAHPDRRRRDRAGGLRRGGRAGGGGGRRRRARPRARASAVTQFEAATAAAFVAFAAAGVEVAVIEAGLGGRLDATNVIPSRVTALTSVGLEHTEWLGETVAEIATEKLAVLREGRRSSPATSDRVAAARARRPPPSAARLSIVLGAAERRDGRAASAPTSGATSPSRSRPPTRILGAARTDAVARAGAAGLRLPGRVEVIDGDPPLILDAAHNPDGARGARRGPSRSSTGGRPVVACLAVLEGKDAAGISAALAPALRRRRLHRDTAGGAEGVGPPRRRSIRPRDSRGSRARAARPRSSPTRGPLERARELARERSGIALCSGRTTFCAIP